jgi:uncharacterized protein with PIN domain
MALTAKKVEDEEINNIEGEGRWQTVYKDQKKNNTPEPKRVFIHETCPDCKGNLEGEIVKEFVVETDTEYPIKTHILWTCIKCGYKYAELEEGRPVTITEFLESIFGKKKEKAQ